MPERADLWQSPAPLGSHVAELAEVIQQSQDVVVVDMAQDGQVDAGSPPRQAGQDGPQAGGVGARWTAIHENMLGSTAVRAFDEQAVAELSLNDVEAQPGATIHEPPPDACMP